MQLQLEPPRQRSPALKWALTHFFRTWTALVTLVAFGAGFLYKPEMADMVAANDHERHRKGFGAIALSLGRQF